MQVGAYDAPMPCCMRDHHQFEIHGIKLTGSCYGDNTDIRRGRHAQGAQVSSHKFVAGRLGGVKLQPVRAAADASEGGLQRVRG